MMSSLNQLLSGYHAAESDWGIEEPPLHRKRFDSVSTSDYSQPPRIRDSYTYKSPTLINRSGTFSHVSDDCSLSGKRSVWPAIQANTDNFSKFIGKYLSFKTNSLQFIEKFKYNLIISNLLDDSLVQSKNEQALGNLLQMQQTEDALRDSPVRLAKLHFYQDVLDDSYLQVTEKKYHLHIPRFERPGTLLNILYLIIFLLKQSMKMTSSLSRASRIEIFKRLLLYSTKYVKFKRVEYLVESFRSLRNLNDFMIANCRINKVIISSFISLRESDLFLTMGKKPQGASPEAEKSHLNMLLDGMTVNIKASIRDSLVHTNGDLLEKYCEINNIPLGLVSENLDVGHAEKLEELLSTKHLTAKLNVFNNLRRFFICQLLTVHDGHSFNYLLLKLGHNFDINFATTKNYTSISSKLRSLNFNFDTHITMLNQFISLNEKFHSLHSPKQIVDYTNDNILSQPANFLLENRIQAAQNDLFPSKRDLNLDNLIDKLQNLTTNLKYYKTYFGQHTSLNSGSRATSEFPNGSSTGLDDYEEKLAIFNLFSNELKSSMELYSSCLTDYKAEGNRSRFSVDSSRSSQTNSKPTSAIDHFGLKSFHTTTSTLKKKTPSEEELKKFSDKRKRYSSGLAGLLTVLEDSKGGDIEDVSHHESFNQAALDALTKKINLRGSSRFSMNSVNSNLSGITDLIASTQFTTDEEEIYKGEDSSPPMNQEDLRRKLEESFTKIYNLEAENSKLMTEKLIIDEELQLYEEPTDEHGHQINSLAAKDHAFLGNLEKTFAEATT